jgi:hypothetical protein
MRGGGGCGRRAELTRLRNEQKDRRQLGHHSLGSPRKELSQLMGGLRELQVTDGGRVTRPAVTRLPACGAVRPGCLASGLPATGIGQRPRQVTLRLAWRCAAGQPRGVREAAGGHRDPRRQLRPALLRAGVGRAIPRGKYFVMIRIAAAAGIPLRFCSFHLRFSIIPPAPPHLPTDDQGGEAERDGVGTPGAGGPARRAGGGCPLPPSADLTDMRPPRLAQLTGN